MGHFLVFAFLVIALGGIWTAVSAWQQYRATGAAVFRSLFLYLVSLILLVFGCFIARYAHTNLIGDDPAAYNPPVWIGSAFGVFIVESAVIWALLDLGSELRREPLSRVVIVVFAITTALIGISYVIGSTLAWRGGFPRWIVGSHQAMSIFLLMSFVFTVYGMVVRPLSDLTADQRRSVRRFGWLLLLGLCIFLVSFVLPASSYLIGFAFGLFWLCCAPLFWLHRFASLIESPLIASTTEAAMALLSRKHNITSREQEVMALIMAGKSNKEIEDLLCISFSTVKNHVYNLYRKLGIKSRAQLMHLVMMEGARQDAGEK